MIINGKTLIEVSPIQNMFTDKREYKGVSYGLDESGYDIRIKQTIVMHPFKRFALASSIERFDMPENLVGLPVNKSTWARQGLDGSMTTKIEPGWSGYLTIELRYAGFKPLVIHAGMGILAIVFHQLSDRRAYGGKYQNQADRPVAPIMRDTDGY